MCTFINTDNIHVSSNLCVLTFWAFSLLLTQKLMKQCISKQWICLIPVIQNSDYQWHVYNHELHYFNFLNFLLNFNTKNRVLSSEISKDLILVIQNDDIFLHFYFDRFIIYNNISISFGNIPFAIIFLLYSITE